MPSGRKNKYWTKEEKEKIVLYHLNNHIGMEKGQNRIPNRNILLFVDNFIIKNNFF